MINQLTNRNFRLLALALLTFMTCGSTAFGRSVDAKFVMDEVSWNEDGNVDFVTTFIPGENGWGAEDESDIYVQVRDSAGTTDNFIPADEEVAPSGGVVASFETHYLDTAQSFLAFGSALDFDDAVFVGFANGQILAGVGSEFDLSGPSPSGVTVEFTTPSTLVHDTRVGMRVGYDIEKQTLRNVQVDPDNDGIYDELLAVPLDLSGFGLEPEEWFQVSYFGKGGTRLDNIQVVQELSLNGDYNRDFLFDGGDVNLLCGGVRSGDLEFDFNGDGTVNLEDRNLFLFTHNGLIADIDFNREVGFSDFLVMSENFGSPGVYVEGDIDCNGEVGFADFLILSENFGIATATQVVPEPNGVFVLLPSLIVLALRRRRF